MELNRDLYIDGVSDYLENGKNIFDKGSLYVYKTIINPITITEQNTGIKIEYTATDIFSGAFVLYNLGLASKYAGKPITCSSDVVLNSNTRGKLTIGLISNDGSTRNILQNGEEITSNTDGYSVSATIPSTISSSTPYLGVWVYFNNNATGSVSIEYSNLQVEEGSSATPYEPHKKYLNNTDIINGILSNNQMWRFKSFSLSGATSYDLTFDSIEDLGQFSIVIINTITSSNSSTKIGFCRNFSTYSYSNIFEDHTGTDVITNVSRTAGNVLRITTSTTSSIVVGITYMRIFRQGLNYR